jgi:hypothetical protein
MSGWASTPSPGVMWTLFPFGSSTTSKRAWVKESRIFYSHTAATGFVSRRSLNGASSNGDSALCLEFASFFAATKKSITGGLQPRGHGQLSCRFSAGVLSWHFRPQCVLSNLRSDLSKGSDLTACLPL